MQKRAVTLTVVALSIITVLTLSFFLGGDEVVPLDDEKIGEDVAVVDPLPSIDSEDELEKKEQADESNENDEEKEQEKKEEEKEKTEAPNKKERETKDELKTEKPKQSEPIKEKQPNKKETEKKQKEEKEKIIAEDKKNESKKDEYLTDPVPEGKPDPVEWQEAEIEEEQYTATLSVTAKTILNNMDLFNKDKLEVLPDDGVIFPKQTVTFQKGESVFDVLLREMKKHKIHMEFVMTPIYNSHYIEGINNLYEFDCGELSGWMYKVNGWFPNYGASRYQLENNDVIEWIYTCDLGRDIGGDSGAIGGA